MNHHGTIIVEVVAGSDMYFWHVFLGRSVNDKTILEIPTLTCSYQRPAAAGIKYTIEREEFEGAYFLADAIYPPYAYLVKSIANSAY